ncbi:uncharacterized protein A4U43_C06F5780 [Asparagus officinalis]|uniref:Uncharacterized protein n=1 Tax=Asparagus officinalis TaxID=4686 RepID=A0A5P1ENX2_ASPOF|nr:uncharacterized protein LOC109844919 [Asparagus officinalis]XP_020269679.1 uncharacterized protein LOC109844919 [Asparagus officinalis]XP_020269680.1 uncharacterized protein LOC109844919 [Asparagus officinalis]XP_020269681.1 uncharacterized protein LOC109844919 [Asparagus officinalis]ONK66251.1 uncharacterized protein A4U43_C06F5780 [Asparagus officinalis]
MSSLNPKKQWRFTFETLAHIPTLRLYLFNPNVNPSTQCLSLDSDLQLSRSLLVVSWIDSEKPEGVSVRVPIPRVLIDPESGSEVRVRDDCIEIKMRLVLPVDHPVALSVRGALGGDVDLERVRPLELDSGLTNLSSGDVHLFCKICSTRLTKEPLRRFMEMPSVNWREVADNWFGACCCSFGGISEKLVLQYIKTYDCAEGTCLLDYASVIICKDDLEGYTFQKCSDELIDNSYKFDTEPNDYAKDVEEGCRNKSEDLPCVCATSTCVDNEVGEKTLDLESASCKREKHTYPLASRMTLSPDCNGFVREQDSLLMENSSLPQQSLNGTQSTVIADSLRYNNDNVPKNLEKLILQSADELSSTGHCHCCTDEAKCDTDLFTNANAQKLSKESGPEKIQKWLHDCSLGSGFMNRIPNLSDDIKWVEFLCRNCSSIVGAYPSYKNRNVPVDGGIRLFKCYLSTSTPVGGAHDVFRKYTLERIFVALLLEGAKDELSHRVVLRDLRTKLPMLQIVLLNSESWCSIGYCRENETMIPLPEVDLQPVVKVLFSDCSTATEASSRIIKDWSSRTHTEDVYMMTFQIEELTKCLKSAANRLPSSCSHLQGMSLSSLER